MKDLNEMWTRIKELLQTGFDRAWPLPLHAEALLLCQTQFLYISDSVEVTVKTSHMKYKDSTFSQQQIKSPSLMGVLVVILNNNVLFEELLRHESLYFKTIY